ncbi:cephalotocin receptor 2-like [Physella acuta]|uniref:cephalotocin receptor 2-like n=1 Tax=Physella acuta TaxID=109671 RepID=UPI0027DBFE41|nr:cephalotocin receptor 2-like [Physella acuta]
MTTPPPLFYENVSVLKGELSLYPDINFSSNLQAETDNSTNQTTDGRDESLVKIEVIVQSITLALAIIGNSCVLTALARRGKAGSRMHLFIFHLSIADLLVAVFNTMPQLIWDITGPFYGGDLLCRFVMFMQVYVMYLSTYMLVMTAIDRYRAVCHPLSAFNASSRTTLYSMIITAYVLSGIFSLPQIIIFKYQQNDKGAYDCSDNFSPMWTLHLYVMIFTFAVYFVPLGILIFAYISICFTIWKKYKTAENERKLMLIRSDSSLANKNIYSHHVANAVVCRQKGAIDRRPNIIRRSRPAPASTTPRSHSLRGFSRAKMKTVKLTFVVIVAYIVCWSPFFVSQLWWMFDAAQEENPLVVIMILLASLNSCCNPWIYLAFSGNLIRHSCPLSLNRNRKCCCCCDFCHFRRRHCYRRRSSSNNNHDDTHSPLSPSDERMLNNRERCGADLELRELIADSINRKRQGYNHSLPDTAGYDAPSKTRSTKTGTPVTSTQLWRKDHCLFKKAVIQNGRNARDLEWTHPLPENVV